MASSITLAGESLKAQKQGAHEVLEIRNFVLALVPGLDPNSPIDRSAGLPPAEQIVGTWPYTQKGFVDPNRVVYSLMLGSNIGDFDWNWIGLTTTEGVLFAVSTVPVQQKRRNIPPLQTGNNVTRNFMLAFDGAQALTAINVDASTWQHDFTDALANKQPLDATLTALAQLVTAANQLIYATGADQFAMTALTDFARTLLEDVDAAEARQTLNLGTAATEDLATSRTDGTIGRVLRVGDGGVLSPIHLVGIDIGTITQSGFFACDECTGVPLDFISGMLISNGTTVVRTQIFNPYGYPNYFQRSYLGGYWTEWSELFHAGNQIALGVTPESARIAIGAAADAALTDKLDKSVVSTFILGLLNDATDAEARQTLGLGTAATRSIFADDDGAAVSIFRVGATLQGAATDTFLGNNDPGIFPWIFDRSTDLGAPEGGTGYWYRQILSYGSTGNRTIIAWPYATTGNTGTVKIRGVFNGELTPEIELFHTGNIHTASVKHADTSGKAGSLSSNIIINGIAVNAGSDVSIPAPNAIGVGQTWQDLTTARHLNTTYTNTSGRTIVAQVMTYHVNQAATRLVVNEVPVSHEGATIGGGANMHLRSVLSALVPNGSTYRIEAVEGNTAATIEKWLELR